jgi:hypothetical protein
LQTKTHIYGSFFHDVISDTHPSGNLFASGCSSVSLSS